MSYDIYLADAEGNSIHLDSKHQATGGTYAIGGTTEAWLNVTYNYAPYFYQTMGDQGIRTIYGMTGRESVPVLQSAADQLAGSPSTDYFKPEPGNAKQALLDLITLAESAPDGIWQGD